MPTPTWPKFVLERSQKLKDALTPMGDRVSLFLHKSLFPRWNEIRHSILSVIGTNTLYMLNDPNSSWVENGLATKSPASAL